MENVLPKISKISKCIQNKKLKMQIHVDGGINEKTACKAVKAGANVLVIGSAVFKNNEGVKNLKRIIKSIT